MLTACRPRLCVPSVSTLTKLSKSGLRAEVQYRTFFFHSPFMPTGRSSSYFKNDTYPSETIPIQARARETCMQEETPGIVNRTNLCHPLWVCRNHANRCCGHVLFKSSATGGPSSLFILSCLRSVFPGTDWPRRTVRLPLDWIHPVSPRLTLRSHSPNGKRLL